MLSVGDFFSDHIDTDDLPGRIFQRQTLLHPVAFNIRQTLSGARELDVELRLACPEYALGKVTGQVSQIRYNIFY